MFLKSRKRKIKTDCLRVCPPTDSLPKHLPQEPGQTEAMSLELNLGSPHGWQGSKYLSHHYGKKLESEVESRPELHTPYGM